MTIYQSGVLASLVSLDSKYAVFYILALIFGDGFNFVAKKYSRELCGDIPLCNRPLFLDGTGSIGDCGVFPKHHFLDDLNKLKTQSFGMPSGHSQLVALTATFWTLYQVGLLKKETDNSKKNKLIFSIVIIWLLALLVMYHRKYTRCHNIEQICIGGILGILFGFLAYLVAGNIPGVDIPDINNILFNSNEHIEETSETDDEVNKEDSVSDYENNQNSAIVNKINVDKKNLGEYLQQYEKERQEQDIQNIQETNLNLQQPEIII